MDKTKENKIVASDKKDNLSMHQKFDQLIDEYYPDLKEEKKKVELKRHSKTCDHVFKSVNRDKTDYARIDENDEPPIFTDLVENESKFGTVKINNPLPKIEKRDELKKSYMKWLKTETLMKPEERRLEYETMQKKYLETLQLTQDIKKDIKLEKTIKAYYPRGIVGVDSIYSEKTLLYKDKHIEIKNKQKMKEKRLKERGKVLEEYNNKNGNFLAFEADSK